MESFRKSASLILSLALLLSLTACSGGDEAEDPEKDYRQAPYYNAFMDWCDRNGLTEEERQAMLEDTVNMDKILYSDEYWTGDSKNELSYASFTAIDGKKALTFEYEKESTTTQGPFYTYELDICCVTSQDVSLEERAPADEGEENAWTRLEKGSVWGDFTVTDASSTYTYPNEHTIDNPLPITQSVTLNGSFAFTGTVSYSYSNDGESITGIRVSIDEEAVGKLPNLTPDLLRYLRDYDEEDSSDWPIYNRFSVNASNQYYQQLEELLGDSGSVEVEFEVDDFTVTWTEYGLPTDGVNLCTFNNIVSMEQKAADE